jgi:hypothetical protein
MISRARSTMRSESSVTLEWAMGRTESEPVKKGKIFLTH